MASQMNPDPTSSSPDLCQPPAPTATPATPERFTLPTSSRPARLEPQVLADSSGPASPPLSEPLSEADKAAEAAAIAAVRQREAKARLLALRRIEWVAIALVTVLLGGAAWSWRSRSDTIESRREAFRSAPIPFGGRGNLRPPAWRAARPSEVKAASRAIKSQLDAFKRDDYAAAEVWQSQTLKQRFGSVSAFRRLIRENYPAFADYKGVRFGSAQALPDGAAVRIQALLRGPKDEPIAAEYILVREGKAYRIDGVSAPSSGPPQREPEQDAQPLPPATAA